MSLTKAIRQLCLACCLVAMAAACAWGVEYEPEAAQPASEPVQQAEPQAMPEEDVEIVVEAVVDPADQQAEAEVQALVEAPKQVEVPEAANAEQKANDFLARRGVLQGWNPDKNVFIAVGLAKFDSEDPSYDDSFLIKRSLKTMEATLSAKAEIIEYVHTEMSAMDQAETPGTDLYAKFNAKVDMLHRKIEAQRRATIKLLEQVDKAEADALRGVTVRDRVKALLDAAIKKLDETYSSGKLAADKQKKFLKIKKRYTEAQAELEKLQQEMAVFKDQEQETLSSKVATIAAMPLLGAVTVAQYESWDEEEEAFEVATVLAWSKSNEKTVRAFLEGKEMHARPGTKTLAQWVSSQDWASASGGRKFKDNKGDIHFIGISAAAVGNSSSTWKRARGIAELMAKKEVATAVFADVSSQKKAEQMLKTYSVNGKDKTIAVESFASKLKQSIENRHISGLGKIYGRELVHPISGQKIYVAIYGMSSSSAKQALKMQDSNYVTRAMDVKHQKVQAAKQQAGVDAVNRAKRQQVKVKQLATPVDKRSAGAGRAVAPTQSQKRKTGAGAQSGVYGGAGSDDFDW